MLGPLLYSQRTLYRSCLSHGANFVARIYERLAFVTFNFVSACIESESEVCESELNREEFLNTENWRT